MTVKDYFDIRPGDLVIRGHRMFRVTGIYLGGEDQENLVGLKSVDLTDGIAHGKTVSEYIMPMDLIPRESVFRAVQPAISVVQPIIKAA